MVQSEIKGVQRDEIWILLKKSINEQMCHPFNENQLLNNEVFTFIDISLLTEHGVIGI